MDFYYKYYYLFKLHQLTTAFSTLNSLCLAEIQILKIVSLTLPLKYFPACGKKKKKSIPGASKMFQ